MCAVIDVSEEIEKLTSILRRGLSECGTQGGSTRASHQLRRAAENLVREMINSGVVQDCSVNVRVDGQTLHINCSVPAHWIFWDYAEIG